MNASFRTAFWAMCLGLTVPMMLFVGVEVTSGGRVPSKRNAAQVIPSESLQARWNRPPAADSTARATGTPVSGAHRSAPIGEDPELDRAAASAVGRRTTAVATIIPRLEPADETGEPFDIKSRSEPGAVAAPPDRPSAGVILDRQIEPDPAAAQDQPHLRPRLPAIPAATLPRVAIVPETVAPSGPSSESRIEAQLDRILGHLGRLASSADERLPAPGPAQQASGSPPRSQVTLRDQETAAQRTLSSGPEAKRPGSADASDGEFVELPDSAAAGGAKATPGVDVPATVPATQSKIYRPRHINVKALEALVTPLLTTGVGRIGAAGAEYGFGPGEMQRDVPTQWDALVVRDTLEVLRKVDRLLQELDVPPIEVMIEATVLTVSLDAHRTYGVDLAEFNTPGQAFAINAAELSAASSEPAAGSEWMAASSTPVLTHGAGVKCGILRGDVRAFLNVLRTAVQVRATAAVQTTVVNKHATELNLSDGCAASADGSRPGSPGAVLRVRPVVTREGLIHLEIRPVPGSATTSSVESVVARGGSLGNQLTLRTGETAVISGLIARELVTCSFRKPGIGELPLVGRLFQQEIGVLERNESIILLTPHLIHTRETAGVPAAKADPAVGKAAAVAGPVPASRSPRAPTTDRPAAGDERSSARSSAKRPATTTGKDAATARTARPTGTEVRPTPARENLAGEIRQAVATSPSASSPRKRPVAGGKRGSAGGAQRPAAEGPPSVDEIPVMPDAIDRPTGPMIRPAPGGRSG